MRENRLKLSMAVVNSIVVAFTATILLLLTPTVQCAAQYEDAYVSYENFYQSLEPYGQWIEDPEYGYVWLPDEDIEFRPYYTNGHWVMTEYGNTWVSGYPWGWACFHYGRWTYDGYYGWLWIPGTDWGPAWVSWRYSTGYYGWAPLGPGFRIGASLLDYSCPGDWWVFIPSQYVYSGSYYQYWQGPRGTHNVYTNSVVINNTFENNNSLYITGPRPAEVRQVTGNNVQVFQIRNSRNYNTRVHNNVVRMYRPAQVQPARRSNGRRVAPPGVIAAPQVLDKPQPVGSNGGSAPVFRRVIVDHNKTKDFTPGTNINQVATPRERSGSSSNNPYEWDVSRPVRPATPPLPKRRPTPKPAPAPAPTRRTAPQPTRRQPAPAAPAGKTETRPSAPRGTRR